MILREKTAICGYHIYIYILYSVDSNARRDHVTMCMHAALVMGRIILVGAETFLFGG